MSPKSLRTPFIDLSSALFSSFFLVFGMFPTTHTSDQKCVSFGFFHPPRWEYRGMREKCTRSPYTIIRHCKCTSICMYIRGTVLNTIMYNNRPSKIFYPPFTFPGGKSFSPAPSYDVSPRDRSRFFKCCHHTFVLRRSSGACNSFAGTNGHRRSLLEPGCPSEKLQQSPDN